MKKPNSPCLGCDNRTEDCHSDCESYLDYVEANEKYKEIIYQSKYEEDMSYTLLEKQRRNKEKKFKKGCYW